MLVGGATRSLADRLGRRRGRGSHRRGSRVRPAAPSGWCLGPLLVVALLVVVVASTAAPDVVLGPRLLSSPPFNTKRRRSCVAPAGVPGAVGGGRGAGRAGGRGAEGAGAAESETRLRHLPGRARRGRGSRSRQRRPTVNRLATADGAVAAAAAVTAPTSPSAGGGGGEGRGAVGGRSLRTLEPCVVGRGAFSPFSLAESLARGLSGREGRVEVEGRLGARVRDRGGWGGRMCTRRGKFFFIRKVGETIAPKRVSSLNFPCPFRPYPISRGGEQGRTKGGKGRKGYQSG